MSSAPTNRGKVVAVWSAHGSPGRTSIAAALACELAKAGKSVVAIDADTYAPSLIQHFGFDQNYSGISAAARALDQRRLNDEEFERLLLQFDLPRNTIRILAGLTMVNRWPEIGFERIREIIAFARERFDFVIVDAASNIERNVVDAKLLHERNSTTLGALSVADSIVAICGADLVAVNRFVWAMQSLRELRLEASVHVVVNRLNQSALGRRGSSEIAGSLKALAEVVVDAFIDEDVPLFARALVDATPVSLVGRNSSAKQAIAAFALSRLLEMPSKPKRRVAKLG